MLNYKRMNLLLRILFKNIEEGIRWSCFFETKHSVFVYYITNNQKIMVVSPNNRLVPQFVS